MPDEEDEKTRLIRREKPEAAAEPAPEQSTRVLEPEPDDGAHTKLVGPARRAVTAETSSSQNSNDQCLCTPPFSKSPQAHGQ